MGRSFHADGPTTEKALRCIVSKLARGTKSSPLAAERSTRRAAIVHCYCIVLYLRLIMHDCPTPAMFSFMVICRSVDRKHLGRLWIFWGSIKFGCMFMPF